MGKEDSGFIIPHEARKANLQPSLPGGGTDSVISVTGDLQPLLSQPWEEHEEVGLPFNTPVQPYPPPQNCSHTIAYLLASNQHCVHQGEKQVEAETYLESYRKCIKKKTPVLSPPYKLLRWLLELRQIWILSPIQARSEMASLGPKIIRVPI